MDYKVTRGEYLQILANCTCIHRMHMFGATQQLLIDLLEINTHQSGPTFTIPEGLMKRVAIANLCDMGLMQYRDSNGECDYATLGTHSIDILNTILRTI